MLILCFYITDIACPYYNINYKNTNIIIKNINATYILKMGVVSFKKKKTIYNINFGIKLTLYFKITFFSSLAILTIFLQKPSNYIFFKIIPCTIVIYMYQQLYLQRNLALVQATLLQKHVLHIYYPIKINNNQT